MATYVLVHGAYHDGSCWDATTHYLRGRGHTVHAPSLPGSGPDGDHRVGHAHYSAHVIDLIVGGDLHEVTLVGHSMGGSVVAGVAEAVPERIMTVVFVAGVVLRDGQRLVDEIPSAARAPLEQALARGETAYLPPFDAVRATFFPTVTQEVAADLYRRYWRPQPLAPLLDRVHLPRFHRLGLPTAYLVGTQDVRGVSPEENWDPYFSSRLPGTRVVRFPGDHEIMLTAPRVIAAELAKLSGE